MSLTRRGFLTRAGSALAALVAGRVVTDAAREQPEKSAELYYSYHGMTGTWAPDSCHLQFPDGTRVSRLRIEDDASVLFDEAYPPQDGALPHLVSDTAWYLNEREKQKRWFRVDPRKRRRPPVRARLRFPAGWRGIFGRAV
jgi:hypothetical protein